MDDGSTDGTADIVRAHAEEDPRVRLLTAPPLPPGWAGKNHACQRLAEAAQGPGCCSSTPMSGWPPTRPQRSPPTPAGTASPSSAASRARRSRSLGELLTVPMINMLLIGYLPIGRMRRTTQPSPRRRLRPAHAGRAAGLPRRGRPRGDPRPHPRRAPARPPRPRPGPAGPTSSPAPPSPAAACIGGLAEAWAGFAKNAHEGMARPAALPVWTVLLAGGHLLPPALVLASAFGAISPWLPAAAPPALALLAPRRHR